MIIVGTATVGPWDIENHGVLLLGAEALIKNLEVCIERILPRGIFDLKEIWRGAPRQFLIVEYLTVTEHPLPDF